MSLLENANCYLLLNALLDSILRFQSSLAIDSAFVCAMLLAEQKVLERELLLIV